MKNVSKMPKPKGRDATQKRKSREELTLQSRERKRQKKHRGHVAGARNNHAVATEKELTNHPKAHNPSLGSRKAIPLLPDNISVATLPTEVTVQLSAQQELDQLENDTRLDALLERIEQGEILTVDEQTYVNTTLDRIDILMSKLGITLEEESEEIEQKEEDMLQLLRRNRLGH